jgi:beta-glucosidase
VTVACSVKNTGGREGADVVQLYVRNAKSNVFRPDKELRGFKKVYLAAGETKNVEISFDCADLSYYNTAKRAWVIENGEYEIMLGASSADIRLSALLAVSGEPEAPRPYGEDVAAAYGDVSHFNISDDVFSHLLGRELPAPPDKLPITMESRFTDLKQTFWGRLLYGIVIGVSRWQYMKANRLPAGTERDNRMKAALFLRLVFESNSLRTLSVSSSGSFPYNVAQGFAELANGRVLRGIARMCRAYRAPAPPRKAKQGKS